MEPDTMGATGPAAVGGRIGRFVVLEPLGRGAMGLVVAAYDPDLDRKVAVKLLRPDLRAPESGERLLREARAMARLQHPNVLAIHEVGIAVGRVFLAMEFAPGGTLRDWCAQQPRSWREILDKFVQAGRGLEAAHQAAMVHRDFKPTNVLLAKTGEAKVADFGLVGLVGLAATAGSDVRGDGDGGELALTRTGSLLGTPAYMAPEQHAGGDVGPAADQFAFCVSVWEAVCGAPPFAGSTISALAANARAYRIVDPIAGTAVPDWLVAALRRGMRPDPADRWPAFAELLAELERAPQRARRRTRVVAAALAAVALTGGGVYAMTRTRAAPLCEDLDAELAGVWDGGRAAAVRSAFERTRRPNALDTFARVEQRLDRYTADWVAARRASCEATHVHGVQSPALLDLRAGCLDRRLAAVDAIVDVLERAHSGDVVDKAVAAVAALAPLGPCADTEALRAAVAPPPDPATRARVAELRTLLAEAKALGDTGQYKLALERASPIATAAELTGHPPVIAEALYRRALLEKQAGDAAAAEATLGRALLAAADARDDRLAAQIWTELLFVVGVAQARFADALKLRPGAEAAVRRAGDDRIAAANLDANVGRVLITAGKPGEAQPLLEQAVALKEQVLGADALELAPALNGLGVAQMEQGKYDDALRTYERARVIWETTLGPEHPDVAGILSNMANVYEAQVRLGEARQRHERALAIREKILGPEHPAVADSYMNLAMVLQGEKRWDDAIAKYQHALALQTTTLGPTHPDLGLTLTNLGGAFYELGRFDDALATFTRALAIFEAAHGGDHADAAFPLANLAEVLLAMRRFEEARALAERSVRLRGRDDVPPADLAYSRLLLGRALLALGRDRDRAVALITQARDVFAAAGDAQGPRLAVANAALAGQRR